MVQWFIDTCAARMSAFGGKADIIQGVAECPLIAKSGHSVVYDRMRQGRDSG